MSPRSFDGFRSKVTMLKCRKLPDMESNTIRIQTNHFHIYLVGPGSGLGVRRKRRKLRMKELSVRMGSNTDSRVSLDLLPKLVKRGSPSHP